MLKAKVFNAGIVLTAAVALARLLQLAGTLIVAALIAPESFGVFAVALITLQFVTSITELAVSDALIQKDDVSEEDYQSAFTLSALRGFAIYAVVALSAYPLAAMVHNQDVIPVILILGLSQVIIGLKSPKLVAYSRAVEPLKPSLSKLAAEVVGFVITVALAVITKSYWSIVVGTVVGQLVGLFVSYYFAPFRPRLIFRNFGWLFRFSIWFNLFAITTAIGLQFDRYYIGAVLGEAAIGIYTLATSIASQFVWVFAAPIMNALFSGLATIKQDLPRLRTGFLISQQAIFAAIFPVGVGLAAIASPLVLLMLGEEWRAAIPIIMIVTPVTAFQMLSVGTHSLALAKGRPDMLFRRNAILIPPTIALTMVGVWQYGMEGAAWTRVVVTSVYVVLTLHLSKTLIGVTMSEQFRRCWRTFIAAGAMAGVCWALQYYEIFMPADAPNIPGLAGLIVSGALVYFAVHFSLWFLSGRPEGAESLAIQATLALKKRVFGEQSSLSAPEKVAKNEQDSGETHV